MRNECDDDDWTPDPEEVVYLTQYDTEQRVLVAIGDFDRIPPWKIGEAAGFSGGTTSDPVKRMSNLRSAVSKATKRRGKLLPSVLALQEKLADFRRGGEKERSVTWAQMIARCDHLILHGTAGESLRAIEVKNKLTGVNRGEVTAEQVVSTFVGRVGAEQAKAGFTTLACGHLIYRVPLPFADKTETDDTEQRIAALEAHDADRVRKGSAGHVSEDAPRDGSRPVSGADAGVDQSRGSSAPGRPDNGDGTGRARERAGGRSAAELERDAERDRAAERDGSGEVVSDEELRRRQGWIGI